MTPHLRRALEILSAHAGFYPIEKTRVLAELILAVRPELCVQIGVVNGRCLLPQALALREAGAGVVFGIDPWDLSGSSQRSEQHAACMKAIAAHNLWDHVRIVTGAAQHVVATFADRSIDILSLAGSACEPISVRTLEAYWPKLRPGAYIWLNDANDTDTTNVVRWLEQWAQGVQQAWAGPLYRKPISAVRGHATGSGAVLLLAPPCTGMHYARTLLELHRQVDLGISEDRPLAVDGSSDSARNPADRAAQHGERLLKDHLLPYFRGTLGGAALQAALAGWSCASSPNVVGQRVSSVTGTSNRERLFYERRLEFAENLGLGLEPKEPRYHLVHGHLGKRYRGIELKGGEFPLVVTLRHPLLSILSLLRRTATASAIEEYYAALEVALTLTDAYHFCIDLAESPTQVLEVFDYLGLEPTPPCRAFAQQRPLINPTTTADEAHPRFGHALETTSKPVAVLKELRRARSMFLEERKLHPLLKPHVQRLRRQGLFDGLERFGYDFTGLA